MPISHSDNIDFSSMYVPIRGRVSCKGMQVDGSSAYCCGCVAYGNYAMAAC